MIRLLFMQARAVLSCSPSAAAVLCLFELVIFCAPTLRWRSVSYCTCDVQAHDLLCTFGTKFRSSPLSLPSTWKRLWMGISSSFPETRIGINFVLDSNGWLLIGAYLTSWLPHPTPHQRQVPARNFAGPQHPAACSCFRWPVLSLVQVCRHGCIPSVQRTSTLTENTQPPCYGYVRTTTYRF